MQEAEEGLVSSVLCSPTHTGQDPNRVLKSEPCTLVVSLPVACIPHPGSPPDLALLRGVAFLSPPLQDLSTGSLQGWELLPAPSLLPSHAPAQLPLGRAPPAWGSGAALFAYLVP